MNAGGALVIASLLVAGERPLERLERTVDVQTGRVFKVGKTLEQARSLLAGRLELLHKGGRRFEVADGLLPPKASNQDLAGAHGALERPLGDDSREPVM